MANALTLPGDLVVPGNLRVSGSISPAMAKSAILAESSLQAFTVPMSLWRTDMVGTPTSMACGKGIFTGTNTVCEYYVSRQGGLIKTEIFVDLTGLADDDATNDIIGKPDDTANCHLGQITAAVNGTIVGGRITCLETPATGDPDIDLYYGDLGTGAQGANIDTADSGSATILINHGDWSAGEMDELTAMPAADEYLYLAVGAGTPDDGTYTAGKLLIELWGTPSTKGLQLVGGTHGTNAPSLQTPDFGDNSAAASYTARAELQLPWEYIAGSSVTIRLHAGMLTTVASEACTVDLEVYKSDEDSTSTGDLCTTAAQDMNSLVFADFDFTVTPTTLSPGDILDVEITVSADDDDDSGVMKACIGSVQLLCDVR